MRLPIENLAGRYCRLRQPGFYWLFVNQAATAKRLVFSTLQQSEASSTFCILSGKVPPDWLDVLAQQGRNVRFFSLAGDRQGAWFLALLSELSWYYKDSRSGDLIIVDYPNQDLEMLAEPRLKSTIATLSGWLKANNRTLLMVGSGDARPLHLRLLDYSDELSGLASLEGSDHQLRYHIDHWRSEEGICAHVDLLLAQDADGLHLLQNCDVDRGGSNADEGSVLALRDCLSGHNAPSREWQLFDKLDALLAAAYTAHAATVVIGVGTNDQVEKLARDIHLLRNARGNRLKIVLRELTQCLRHVDERLLFAAGTNLLVPYMNDVSRFLSQMQSVQGQQYRRMSDISFDALIDALRPQFLKGYVTADLFLRSVRGELDRQLGEELSGLLLCLQPSPRLTALDVLAQCTLKRRGDFITLIDNRLYVFLFACLATDLDQAFGNIFRLPYGQLVAEVNVLDNRESMENALSALAVLPLQQDYSIDLAKRQGIVADAGENRSAAEAAVALKNTLLLPTKIKLKALPHD